MHDHWSSKSIRSARRLRLAHAGPRHCNRSTSRCLGAHPRCLQPRSSHAAIHSHLLSIVPKSAEIKAISQLARQARSQANFGQAGSLRNQTAAPVARAAMPLSPSSIAKQGVGQGPLRFGRSRGEPEGRQPRTAERRSRRESSEVASPPHCEQCSTWRQLRNRRVPSGLSSTTNDSDNGSISTP